MGTKAKTILFLTALLVFTGLGTSWWNDSWEYRKPVNITEESGSDLSNYQTKISINTSTLISKDKMQDDCSDLRFANSTDAELDFWIESGCNTQTTEVWVKIPELPANSEKKIYAYYGTSDTSDGEATIGTQSMPAYSCRSIYNQGDSSGDGDYWIDPNGGETSDSFQSYCDMSNGGWSLMMKGTGGSTTFSYSSSYWENSNTLNTGSDTADPSTYAKFETYNQLEFNEIKAFFPRDQDHLMDESFGTAQTGIEIFSGENIIGHEETDGGSNDIPCPTDAGIGRYGDYWYNYDGETNGNNADSIFARQCGWQDYGFDVDRSDDGCGDESNVRWGWIWNNEENSCETSDKVAGLGVGPSGHSTDVGSVVTWNGDNGELGEGGHPRDFLIYGQTPDGETFSDTRTISEVGAESSSFCDRRGPKDECILESKTNLSSQNQKVEKEFQAEPASVFEALTAPGKITVSNSSFISGLWTGSFNLTSQEITIQPGAEFRPENGNILINEN